MPELSYHGGFILAAYAVTIVVLAGIVLWTLLDGRAQKRRLAELEARGVRRRSAAPRPAPSNGTPAGAAP